MHKKRMSFFMIMSITFVNCKRNGTISRLYRINKTGPNQINRNILAWMSELLIGTYPCQPCMSNLGDQSNNQWVLSHFGAWLLVTLAPPTGNIPSVCIFCLFWITIAHSSNSFLVCYRINLINESHLQNL